MHKLKSHAVTSQRIEPKDGVDDFPTPPWGIRAPIEHGLFGDKAALRTMTCLEPACGRGHMAETLKEYFGKVVASDLLDYGYDHAGRDFLTYPYQAQSFDWVITNPPCNRGKQFVLRALPIARVGVAIIARTQFLEGAERYGNLFEPHPPTVILSSSSAARWSRDAMTARYRRRRPTRGSSGANRLQLKATRRN